MALHSVPENAKTPIDCVDMIDVRSGVDEVDSAIIELLARRFAYMDAAARIKAERDTVRDEARKAQVIATVRRLALNLRVPQEVVTEMWEILVEGSIAYEFRRWDELRGLQGN